MFVSYVARGEAERNAFMFICYEIPVARDWVRLGWARLTRALDKAIFIKTMYN